MRRVAVLALALATSTLAACGAPEPAAAGEESLAQAATQVESGTWYEVRRDLRRCVAPVCGGFWIREANARSTPCPTGGRAAECYVAGFVSDFDLTTDPVMVVKGTTGLQDYVGFGKLGVLTVDRAFAASSDVEGTDTLFLLEDNGVRCITTPCFSLDATVLNTRRTGTLSGIEGALSVNAGAALGLGGVIAVSGHAVRTPDGGRAVAIDQYYTPLQPAAPLGGP